MSSQVSISQNFVGEILLTQEGNLFFHLGEYQGKAGRIAPAKLSFYQLFIDHLKELSLMREGSSKVSGCIETVRELYHEFEVQTTLMMRKEEYRLLASNPQLLESPSAPNIDILDALEGNDNVTTIGGSLLKGVKGLLGWLVSKKPRVPDAERGVLINKNPLH